MSVKVMGQVWELALPHNELLVLLAMADHADHDGYGVRPSLDLVAWKTGYEVRQVRRTVRRLEAKHLLVITKHGGGRHNPTEYAVRTENGVKKSGFSEKADIMTGNQKKPGHYDRESGRNPDIMTGNQGETRTFVTQNPDIAMSGEPYEPKTKNLTTEENPF